MAGEMHHQCVTGPTVGEEIIDARQYDVGRFISHHVHIEGPDPWIAQDPGEGHGVLRRRHELLEPFVLVAVVGDDQCMPGFAHDYAPGVE
nr:hypothetical protein [Streptomyces inhibens]